MQPIAKTVEIKSGFYPCLIYLSIPSEFDSQQFISTLKTILLHAQAQFQPISNYHISLTKTVHLLQNQIKPTIQKIRKSILSCQIKLPLILLLKRVIIIDNFVAVQLHQASSTKLLPMVRQIQKLTKTQFYQKPIFHISLFKILSPLSQQTVLALTEVQLTPRRSLTLKTCMMKHGIHSSQINTHS